MEVVFLVIFVYVYRDLNSFFRGLFLNMNREIKIRKNIVNRMFKVLLNMFFYIFRKIKGY